MLVVCLALAGCQAKKSDKNDAETGTNTSGGGTGTGTGTGTSSGTNTGGPGLGTITLNFTRSTPNGAVPLGVNFTLEATFARAGSSAPPSGASWTVTTVAVGGNDSLNASAPAMLTGTTLPVNFTLNFTVAGNFSVKASIKAPGYAPSNKTILVAAIEGGPGAPIFFDGAEGDASQWTITAFVYINGNFPAPANNNDEYETTQTHPDGGWTQGTTQFHAGAKSWGTTYPDNLRTRMTSAPFEVPASGATLSYWVKGGAEENNVDGIHVLTGASPTALTKVAYHTAVIADWTEFSVPLLAGPTVVQFRFDSDVGCSNESPPPQGGAACAAGWDGGGMFLDDILVK